MDQQQATPTKVWNSEYVLKAIRAFYAADKPPAITTHDIDLVVLLMVYKALDHYVTHSIDTLARSLKKDVKTIRTSIAHLIDLGWLHRVSREGASSELMLIADNLPLAELADHKVTDDAKALATLYQQVVVTMGMKDRKKSKKMRKRQATKRWLYAQQYTAQNILNKCDGDAELARQMLRFAFEQPKYARAANTSLYSLHKYWKGLENSYADHLQDEAKKHEATPVKEVTQ
jgi:hypothetical protein